VRKAEEGEIQAKLRKTTGTAYDGTGEEGKRTNLR
jgi:hypothetical protein